MIEDTIKKVKFNNPNPIEIFCDQQFDKGYYLRGNIFEFSDYIYDPNIDDYVTTAIYRFVILVLVNDEYQKKVKKLSDEEDRYFIFKGNTEKDFLKLQKKFYQKHPEIHQEVLINAKYYGGMEKYQNRNLIINRDEVRILEKKYKKYLEDSIKFKKESIVLSMDIYLKEISQEKELYPESIFLLPVLHFSKKKNKLQDFDRLEPDEFEFDLFLNDLIVYLHTDLDYQNYLDSDKYIEILADIGDLSYERISKKRVTRNHLTSLSQFRKSIGNRTDPVSDFCYKFFDDMTDYLNNQYQISLCPICRNYFINEKGNVTCGRKKCIKKAEQKELKVYEELEGILKKYNLRLNLSLSEILELYFDLDSKRNRFLRCLYEKLKKENPHEKAKEIIERMKDKFPVSDETIKHAKF